MARKPWIGGNWKCNGTLSSISDLGKALNESAHDTSKVDVVICPSPIQMAHTRSVLNEKFIVASQNVSKSGNGAFTGETAAVMLKDAGYEWTLIGHSERRQYYGETDAVVADKVAICQETGLFTAVCIGEMLPERESGKTNDVIKTQMEAFIPKVADWSKVVVAYEPVWAIGTGKVATPQQAQDAHAFIRGLLKEKVSSEVADSVRIVYGGSVNEGNCEELIKLADVDGFLVGGAALKPSFTKIINCA